MRTSRHFSENMDRIKIGFSYRILAWKTESHRENQFRYPEREWKRHGLLWSRETKNLIPTVGAERFLINTFPSGAETTITAWYLSLMAATAGQQTTGAMTAASAVLTLAVAFGTAPVVGQVITVFGAGAGGGNLVTTVSVVTSTTSLTLAANAGTTVSGAACVMGPSVVVGDTSASHAGWVEVSTAQVTQATRSSFAAGLVGTSGNNAIKSNSGTPAAYTGNTPNWYMTGLFLVSTDVFGATADTLLSEAAFDATATPPGAALVQNGIALSIQGTMTMTAA